MSSRERAHASSTSERTSAVAPPAVDHSGGAGNAARAAEAGSEPELGFLDQLMSVGAGHTVDSSVPTDDAVPATYAGTSTPLPPDDRGDPVMRPVGGFDLHNESTDGLSPTRKSGTTAYTTTGETTRAVARTSTTADSLTDLTLSDKRETSIVHTSPDPEATAARVRSALSDEATGADARATALRAHIEELETAAAEAEAEENNRAILKRLARVRDEYAEARTRAVDLRAASRSLTTDTALDLARANGIRVEGATTSTSRSITRDESLDADADGTLSYRTSRDTRSSDAIGTEATSETSSRGVKVDGGIFLTSASSASSTSTVGDATYSESASASSHAGLVIREDEVGIGYGSTSTTAENGFGTSRSSTVEATNKGAATKQSAGVSAKTEHLTLGATTSSSGSFRVEVTEAANTSPQQYNLTVSINVGGTLGTTAAATGSTKGGSKGTASVGASAGVSGALVFTHRMSHDDAQAYLVQLNEADEGHESAGPPEVSLLGHLAAARDNAEDITNAAALVDSNVASGIAEGDSVSLTLTGTAAANASLGGTTAAGVGLGITGAASAELTRQISISRDRDRAGAPRVVLTVAFTDKSSTSAGANGTLDGVSASGSHTDATSAGYSAIFHLNPAAPGYDAAYTRIIGAASESALHSLERDPAIAALAGGHTSSESGTTTNAGTIGLLGVSGGMSDAHHHSESFSTSERGDTVTVSGGNKVGGEIKLGDVTLLGSSTDTSATARMSESGELDLRLEERGSSTEISPTRDSHASDDSVGGLGRVMETGGTASLERLLTETFAHLRGFRLNQAAFDQLVVRAADAANWDGCVWSPSVIDAWQTVRRALVSPTPAAEFPRDDIRARRLTQARALVAFYEAHGRRAQDTVENALRNWGARFNGSTASTDTADLGLLYNFPDSIAHLQPEFDALGPLCQAAGGVASRASSFTEVAAAQAQLGGLTTRITTLRSQIRGATDFDEPRARMEMLNELDRYSELVALAVTYLQTGAAPSTSDPAIGATADLARVRRIEALLAGFHAEERAVFAQMQAQSISDAEGLFGTLSAMGAGIIGDSWQTQNTAITQLYELWITTIRELRAAYTAVGTPAAEWKVSATAADARHPGNEPNAERYIHFLLQNSPNALAELETVTRRRYSQY